MYLQTFIPLFLAVHIPVENGMWEYWEYGLEYIFNVNMYVGKPLHYEVDRLFWYSSNVTYRLFCTPKSSRPWGRKTVLSCRLRNANNCAPAKNTDTPFELLYNKMGIEKMVVPESTGRFDLHILKLVAGQLDPATNFKDVEHVSRSSNHYKFDFAHESIVGKCVINFDITRQSMRNERSIGQRSFRLVPLLQELHINSNKEKIIINKTIHPNTCLNYRLRINRYFYTFPHNVKLNRECQQVILHLDTMTSLMQIEKNSFVSSTKREGKLEMSDTRVSEIIEVTLEDVRPVTRKPVPIVQPKETTIDTVYQTMFHLESYRIL